MRGSTQQLTRLASRKDLWTLPLYEQFVILQVLPLISSVRAYRVTRRIRRHSAAEMGVPEWAASLDAGLLTGLAAFAVPFGVVLRTVKPS